MKSTKQTWTVFADDLSENPENLTLSPEEHHYVFKVLRLQTGETVRLTDGHGKVAEGLIKSLSKKNCDIDVQEIHDVPRHKIHCALIVGQTKPATLEECVRVSAKLGCDAFHIFQGERTQIKTTPKVEKLERISWEALRVSKGAFVMDFLTHANLQSCLQHLKKNHPEQSTFRFVCDESFLYDGAKVDSFLHAVQRILECKSQLQPTHLQIFIGPEASFSEKELQQLRQEKHMQGVGLGNLILEVPLAIASVLSVFQQLI